LEPINSSLPKTGRTAAGTQSDWVTEEQAVYGVPKQQRKTSLIVAAAANVQHRVELLSRRLHRVHDVREREIRDLPWSVYRVTVVVKCTGCGVRIVACGKD
jgi:hypothetical protein